MESRKREGGKRETYHRWHAPSMSGFKRSFSEMGNGERESPFNWRMGENVGKNAPGRRVGEGRLIHWESP